MDRASSEGEATRKRLYTVPGIDRSASIDRLVVGESALEDTAQIFHDHFGDAPALIIADESTYQAAGAEVYERLSAADVETHTEILPARSRLAPDRERGDAIAVRIRELDAKSSGSRPVPVAVGSGVVNDLTRYAAFNAETAFMSVPTAVSMDGYTSAGAPLVDKGFKITIQCAPPRVILADLNILATAPAEMSGWGYGDLAGKIPAGGDWLVADELGIEPLDGTVWPLVQDNLRGWLSMPEGVRRGERAALAELFIGLAATGVAMELYGSSRPASGADHQIAHIWEMEDLSHRGEKVSHGACVAIGGLTVLTLFDWLIRQDLTTIDAEATASHAPNWTGLEGIVQAAFANGTIAARALEEMQEKWVSGAVLVDRLEKMKETWPVLQERLKRHLMREPDMRELLSTAGAPVRVRDIGLSPERHRATVRKARWIRKRYTVLDILGEAGLLERAIAESLHDGHPLYA
ncbi:sn-glycerol-1-phosphate dehydrogenase [Chelativorans sp. YIM 93263]|uniref:sn-glycerol-1-phosphate dehydrogenase n=1 Tax=Chelativorans sp. YIM 93263 TaxID=2906648 RepID=UPI002377FD07|nr:sn-glycerol-1-phosphate dehydrogenase [Chelativorans sp. YIM 93263]